MIIIIIIITIKNKPMSKSVCETDSKNDTSGTNFTWKSFCLCDSCFMMPITLH